MNNFLSLSTLPYVSLIKGTISTELKSSIIADVVEKHEINQADVMIVESLTVEASQNVKNFASYEPLGVLKLIVVFLDKATVRAQNSLLAILESPPSNVKFILYASNGILGTIQSRSEVFNILQPAQPSKQAKAAVLTVLKAASELNDVLLEDLFRNWDDEAHALLLEWAVEFKLRKPLVFLTEELLQFKFPTNFEDNLLTALSAMDSARSRLSAKSIMISYVQRNKGI